jgi:hypothetical protein
MKKVRQPVQDGFRDHSDRRPAFKDLPSRTDRMAMGKALRERCPRAAHGAWKPSLNRPDPLELVVESSKGRIPQLVRFGTAG